MDSYSLALLSQGLSGLLGLLILEKKTLDLEIYPSRSSYPRPRGPRPRVSNQEVPIPPEVNRSNGFLTCVSYYYVLVMYALPQRTCSGSTSRICAFKINA